jgi:hypothetical protein
MLDPCDLAIVSTASGYYVGHQTESPGRDTRSRLAAHSGVQAINRVGLKTRVSTYKGGDMTTTPQEPAGDPDLNPSAPVEPPDTPLAPADPDPTENPD